MNELFILLGVFTLASAGTVVLAKNPVYSAFALILSFFGLSGIYLLRGAPFIAMIQILVYTGAIVVLFVYVVMLLNLGKGTRTFRNGFVIFLSCGAAWFFCLMILRLLNLDAFQTRSENAAVSLKVIAKLLFTQYLWPFEILSLFILVMLVAIISITKEGEAA